MIDYLDIRIKSKVILSFQPEKREHKSKSCFGELRNGFINLPPKTKLETVRRDNGGISVGSTVCPGSWSIEALLSSC